MKNIRVLLLLMVPVLAAGQVETVQFNDINYQKIGYNYFLLDDYNQNLQPVSPNQITLKYVSGATESQIASFEVQQSLLPLRKASTGWIDYQLIDTTDLFVQCNQIQGSSLVVEVIPGVNAEFDAIPNDSAARNPFGSIWYQWGIPNTYLQNAWNKTKGSSQIVLAIIDSGVNWLHEDFAQATGTSGTFWLNPGEDAWSDVNDPNTGDGIDNDGNGYIDDWRGWDFMRNSNNVMDADSTIPHGTSVAGIAAARANNGIGVAGVAGGWSPQDGVKVMVVKVTEMSSIYGNKSNHTMDEAILYAAKNGADIINISMGFSNSYTNISRAIDTAFYKYNCVVVASTGNHQSNHLPVKFPANHPLVLSVAKTNTQNWTLQSHTGDNLDIGAPGHGVPVLNYQPKYNPQHTADKYVMQSGTSLAAPFVAGVAGLMLSINPCLDNEEVYNILKRRADRVNPYNSTTGLGYRYWDNIKKPGHSMDIGYGRVNAEQAVNTAEAMKENSLDLYIKDHYNDFGYAQSYADTSFFDHWSDIWVREQPDGHIHQEMEEIEYTISQPAYVYVRVRNKSCVASTGADSLKLYWTKFSSVSSWPQNWNGQQPTVGNKIGEVAIPPLAAGEDTILQFTWTITAQQSQQWGNCLMARIVSIADPITSDPNLAVEIRNNNNIAIRNLQILNIFPGKMKPIVDGVEYPHGVHGLVGLSDNGVTTPVDLHLDVPYHSYGIPITEDAEVKLIVSEEFWQVFQATQPTDWEGIEIAGERELLINSPHARIRNLEFAAGQRCSVYVGFSFLTDEVDSTYLYSYHISQYQDGNLGAGMHFNIGRVDRSKFEADAGPDQFIHQGQSAQLQASDIGEPATYNWYDSADSLFYSGKSPTVSPEVTEQYKLEVIAEADLYKDYDEVEVVVNPYAIISVSPNPASNEVNIAYDADEANVAYLIVQPISGGSGNSYNLSTTEGEKTIMVSNYVSGAYAVLLVCDGIVVDSALLTIQ